MAAIKNRRKEKKMTIAKANKIVTPRDIAIFQYLYENRVATVQQINRDVFGYKAKSVVCKRLDKLNNGGWIKRGFALFGSRTRHTYSITEETFQRIIKNDVFDYTYTQIQSDSKTHDITLVDIKHSLTQLKTVTDYKTENIVLQNKKSDAMSYVNLSYHIRSDALMTVTLNQNSDFVFPIEYESINKKEKRYASKAAQYYAAAEYNIVLYIYSDPQIYKNLTQAEQSIVQDEQYRFYFCKTNDVINHSGSVTFTNQKGETIMID